MRKTERKVIDHFYPIVVLQMAPDDGGGFVAYAPDLPGCLSDGETPEEALANGRLAVLEWCDEMRARGKAIPDPMSASKAAKEKRQRLLDLLQKQAELLQVQNQQLRALETQLGLLENKVESLRYDVEDMVSRVVAETDGADMAPQTWFGRVPTPPLRLTIKESRLPARISRS